MADEFSGDSGSQTKLLKDMISLVKKLSSEFEKIDKSSKNMSNNLKSALMGGSGQTIGERLAASSGTYTGGFSDSSPSLFSKIGSVLGGAIGVATSAANALPTVQQAVSSQLLTSQARFSGMQGNVNSTVKSLMGMGTTSSSTDVQQAIALGTSNGLLPGLSGYNSQIMPGVMQLSNLTGSAQSGMQAAAALNTGQSVNTLRMMGIQVRGANGAMRNPAEIFKNIYDFAVSQSNGNLNKGNIAIALQPGNGLANLLDAVSAGDPTLRNALQSAALQFAQGGNLSKASLTQTGMLTGAVNSQSRLNQSQFGLLSAAAPAEAAGFSEANRKLSALTDTLSHYVTTNQNIVKQIAKGETLLGSQIGQSVAGALTSVLGGLLGAGIGKGLLGAGKSLFSKIGSRFGSAAASAGEAGLVGEAVGGAETFGLSGVATAALAFIGGLVAPSIIKNITGGGGKQPGGALVTPHNPPVQSAGGANLVVSTATSLQGIPYSWGGGNLQGPTTGISQGANTNGFDCSSLVRYVMARMGVVLPRTSQEQQKCGIQINPTQAQAGDLLFWGIPAHHVAIYVGNGMMVQAPHTGGHVEKVPVNLGSVTSASRVIGSATGAAVSGNLNKVGGPSDTSGGIGNLSGILESIGGNTLSGVNNQGVSTSDLRGYNAAQAMSGGGVGGSGMGLGSTAGASAIPTNGMSQRYLSISPKTGTLDASVNTGQPTINYGGVTITVPVPQGSQLDEQKLATLIKKELVSIGIQTKVANG